MSEQNAPTKSVRGGRRGAQAVAGIAGAVACLGIGWAAGARSAGTGSAPAAATVPITQPTSPTIRWGDDDGPGYQWGTIPGTGGTPAQPGTGVVPPSTGSGGSSVAATTTTALTPTNVSAPTTGTTGGLR